jgi:hypothetical protein
MFSLLLLLNSSYRRWGHGDDAVVRREMCRSPPQQHSWPLRQVGKGEEREREREREIERERERERERESEREREFNADATTPTKDMKELRVGV